jgi:hypothetical protein
VSKGLHIRCSICANPLARKTIDGGLDEGMTAAGISRMLEGIGATVSQDVINRHRKHYRDGQPERPKGTSKTDFAIVVRDRAADMFESEDLDLRNKDHVAGINSGLKAQAILDAREKVKAKQGNAELAFAIIGMLTGQAPPAQLEDGNTIEGEAVEVDGVPE